MKAYKIKDVKGFMAHILTRDTFDDFLIADAKIVGKAVLNISGNVPYGNIRDVCLAMVRGSQTPEVMQFLLLLPKVQMEDFVEGTDSVLTTNDVENLSILVRFKDGTLSVTAGSAYHIFSMDKTLDVAWEKYVEEFLTTKGIDWEPLL